MVDGRGEAVEGVGPKTAKAILAWAADQAEVLRTDSAEAGAGTATAESEMAAAVMDEGDDFMAALSQALAEAEKNEADASAVLAGEETTAETGLEDLSADADKRTSEEE